MTPDQILAWAQAAQILMAAGVATVASLRAMFGSAGLSEDEQNQILDAVIANAGTRKRRRKAIVDGTE